MDKTIIIQTLILASVTLGTYFLSRRDYSRLGDRVNRLGNRVNRLYGLVSQIVDFLDAKFGGGFKPTILPDADTTQSNSPVTLNAKGQKLAAQLKVSALVDKYHASISIPEGATEYTIQKICFTFADLHMLEALSQKERDIVEKAIYENNRDGVLFVYAVLFRDYFLKQRGFKVPEYGE